MSPEAKLIEETARLSYLYGLGIVLAIIITFAFIGLIWLVLKAHRKDKDDAKLRETLLMEKSEKREERLMNFLENGVSHVSQLLIAHDQRAMDYMKESDKAAACRADEHKEMMQVIQHVANKVGA